MLTLPNNKEVKTLDLTALLDVLFIILVFLMLSVAVKINILEVDLPTAGIEGEEVKNNKPLVISILYNTGGNVSFAIDKAPYSSIEMVIQALQHTDKNISIFLAIDENVQSHYTIKLLAQLSKRNIQIANILIKRE